MGEQRSAASQRSKGNEIQILGFDTRVPVGVALKQLVALIAVVAAGCATPTTGVVPASGDAGAYTVTRQGSSALVSTSDLKAEGLKEASAHCRRMNKSIKVIDTSEIQARPFGGWPEARIVFTCV